MIEINIADQALLDALGRLANNSTGSLPAWQSIGEALVNSTQQRFREHQSPDGTPWQSLSPVTTERKGHDRTLEGESQQLAKQISYRAVSDGVAVGSPMEYAAMQHFGGTREQFPNLWGDIPARPFLGLSDGDEDQALEILTDFLNR